MKRNRSKNSEHKKSAAQEREPLPLMYTRASHEYTSTHTYTYAPILFAGRKMHHWDGVEITKIESSEKSTLRIHTSTQQILGHLRTGTAPTTKQCNSCSYLARTGTTVSTVCLCTSTYKERNNNNKKRCACYNGDRYYYHCTVHGTWEEKYFFFVCGATARRLRVLALVTITLALPFLPLIFFLSFLFASLSLPSITLQSNWFDFCTARH